ncbi:MAG: competence/damage-inducible protein A [Thermoleophilaceae bacterium]
MSARAGIVVTGTEVLSGRVGDQNGPWLADRLFEQGVDLAHTLICGDRPADMEAALRFMAGEGLDLVITSGGLGPTADDLTAEIVARFSGRQMQLDEALERRISEIVAPLMKRYGNLDGQAIVAASRKQATVPRGAEVLEPAGTAPGLVVSPASGSGPTIAVLPGPPRELQAMWAAATATEAFRAATAARTRYDQHILRMFGIPESEIAETLRIAERKVDGFGGLEITTCLRRGELEVVVRHEPAAAAPWLSLRDLVVERHAGTLFSRDGSSVDEQVAELLAGRTLALAESCTGGLLAGRLTERPGSSDYVAGGVVSYSNRAKIELLGVEADLIARHGAVSVEVAEAMADGALARFSADTAVAVTGVAGPGGGTAAKPVGYVCFAAKCSDGRAISRDPRVPGDRTEVRDRSTTIAMHLLRRLLLG